MINSIRFFCQKLLFTEIVFELIHIYNCNHFRRHGGVAPTRWRFRMSTQRPVSHVDDTISEARDSMEQEQT